MERRVLDHPILGPLEDGDTVQITVDGKKYTARSDSGRAYGKRYYGAQTYGQAA